jgi:predicted helicase
MRMKQQVPAHRNTPPVPGYIDMYAPGAPSPDAAGDAAVAALFGMEIKGVHTKGDPVYANASQSELRKNVRRAIQCQNQELFDAHHARSPALLADVFLEPPSPRLKQKIRKFYAGRVFLANYRPFNKSWIYDASVLMRISARPVAHDFPEATSLAICFSNRSEKGGVTAFMVSGVSDLEFFPRSRLFPLQAYRCATGQKSKKGPSRDADGGAHCVVADGITDQALAQFHVRYACPSVSKDDIFYYLYGVLHSVDCGTRYAADLRRDPPRIPVVKSLSDFKIFSEAGRALALLHVNYDAVAEYPVKVHRKDRPPDVSEADYWRVDQMKFGPRSDRTRIIYNAWISLSGIPREAYDYMINERPALVWAMESQGIKKHAASGVSNDANRWATEVMGDPAYPLKLLQRVITLSLETVKIVDALPFLE